MYALRNLTIYLSQFPQYSSTDFSSLIFLGHSFGVSSASLILYLEIISALYPIEKIVTPLKVYGYLQIVTPFEGIWISPLPSWEWEKGGLLVALQLILLPLVFKTEKNCSTTPKLPKSINSNSLFLVIHQFRRKSCFSCVFSFSFSLCLLIYSCALSGTPSTFFGFWRTTTSSVAAITSVPALVLFWALRVLRA